MAQSSELMPCAVVCSDGSVCAFPGAWYAQIMEEGDLVIIRKDGGMLGAFAKHHWLRIVPLEGAADG